MQTCVLELWERSVLRHMLGAKLSVLSGNAFEVFFHEVMSARHGSYVDVATHGDLGDIGADGLMLTERRLYACNGPEVDIPRPVDVRKKVRDDFATAMKKRRGEFDTFVFVHNNRRGMHPEVAVALAALQKDNPDLVFENFGHRRFYDEFCRLERHQIEDLLGPFPAQKVVTGVGLNDVLPLLEHLASERRPMRGLPDIPVPAERKLEYNAFSPDLEDSLRQALKYVPSVHTYYDNCRDPGERDEVAAAFKDHYLLVAEKHDSPDDVLYELECYILGNERTSYRRTLDAQVVLMYFFEECDIGRLPPNGWRPVPEPRSGA
ncbi:hypothetical protein F8568_038570 [Actinomadura sp. LD22]|uniref:ABC-three component systems C-terminal domain-containing protein n=1 Tax=Actinomadura physcomitrii TaxID=2650748 RepID=A0A6I4MV21_9ACTN|nr:ABC-three component system protein [Actinomadura physcomitrii]MWA06156.1 hypothetical protein [Actinomadura physcomitrii]